MDLYQWLIRSVGWGKEPRPRRNLFEKLCRLARAKGEEVKRVILEVFNESRTRCDDKPPDHYFCHSIKLRLMERDLWYEPRPYDHLSGADLDAQFKDYGPLPLFEKEAGKKPDLPEPPPPQTPRTGRDRSKEAQAMINAIGERLGT